jgi:hypothetical protein
MNQSLYLLIVEVYTKTIVCSVNLLSRWERGFSARQNHNGLRLSPWYDPLWMRIRSLIIWLFFALTCRVVAHCFISCCNELIISVSISYISNTRMSQLCGTGSKALRQSIYAMYNFRLSLCACSNTTESTIRCSLQTWEFLIHSFCSSARSFFVSKCL